MSNDLVPVRCVTCNKILGDKWERYTKMIDDGVSIEQALNNLGLTRYCCRLRLRNPFKYVESVGQEETLHEARNTKAPTTAALAAMSIPKDEDVDLPPLPMLPPASDQKKTIRIYQAW